GGALRPGRDDQPPAHHGRAREMALEDLLVDGDVLEPDNALVRLELDNPVDEQKRIPVRQDLHDLHDAVDRFLVRLGALLRLGGSNLISHNTPSKSAGAALRERRVELPSRSAIIYRAT